MIDLFTFIPIGILTVLLFYLSHKEMKKSLEQSKISAQILAQDHIELERKLRESELARITELTKAAEFGRLSQGIFHDLMTPLTSIILHTESLKNDATQKNLEKAVEAGNRMTRYIQDIRKTLSHEESPQTCLLGEECENILHLLAYKSKSHHIDIVVMKAPEASWYGNPIKLRQIFSNLLSNAIDSFETKVGGRKNMIHISLAKSFIEIKDNGCGISQGNMDKIGTAFFTTKPVDKGTGLGLSTVKSIVEKDMRGTLEIESEEGKGTLVRIRYTDLGASPLPPQTPPLLV